MSAVQLPVEKVERRRGETFCVDCVDEHICTEIHCEYAGGER